MNLGVSPWQMWKDIYVYTFEIFKVTWEIWMFMGIIVIGKFLFHIYGNMRLSKSRIYEVDRMDGKTFEKYLEVLFRKLGYKVERTRYIGDYGADLIVSNDGIKTVMQAKRFKNKVGVKAIQEALAAKGYYECTEAMVVTNSFYTKQAIELAKANRVKLWNREDLVKALLLVKENGPIPMNSKFEVAATSEEAFFKENSPYKQDICAYCGKPVSEKVRDYCLSNQHRYGGKVYCFDHQRNR